ncbi:hypothetical protein FLAG1_08438 [Fusarium langsethiae]|uniref:Uncharacterized protein n=1 Tax=Fusarium langsethiae TaxID=179993 RepID=A0A0M9ESF5_FUSLA|nr:hypothetical protein FLAG1_08438 [Fusarium langsethiae]GKU05558.1 unnamed protein product [Fusarium langsethiae]GKU11412.1 unnamed protein product [Fusarium langsethiae]
MVERERPPVYPSHRDGGDNFWGSGAAIALYVIFGLLALGAFLCCIGWFLQKQNERDIATDPYWNRNSRGTQYEPNFIENRKKEAAASKKLVDSVNRVYWGCRS